MVENKKVGKVEKLSDEFHGKINGKKKKNGQKQTKKKNN